MPPARRLLHMQSEVAVKALHGAGRDEELTLSHPMLSGLLAVSAVWWGEPAECLAQMRPMAHSRPVNGAMLHSTESLTLCMLRCAALCQSSQEATTMATLRHPCCVQFLVCGVVPSS